jgi:hypothetical protein
MRKGPKADPKGGARATNGRARAIETETQEDFPHRKKFCVAMQMRAAPGLLGFSSEGIFGSHGLVAGRDAAWSQKE